MQPPRPKLFQGVPSIPEAVGEGEPCCLRRLDRYGNVPSMGMPISSRSMGFAATPTGLCVQWQYQKRHREQCAVGERRQDSMPSQVSRTGM